MSVDSAGVVRVGDLAAGQWGMFTSAQARHRGLSAQHLARLAKTGALERVRHGVYRTAASPGSAHDSLRAAWLALAPDLDAHERVEADDVEVVSHRSAAVVHQLGDLDADYLEFTTAARKQTRDPQVRFHRRSLRRDQWTLVEGLVVTTVVTTIEDLAGAHLDGGHLSGVVRDALTTAHVDLDDVAGVLAPHAHLYGADLGQGRQLVQQLLEQAGVPRSTQDVAQLLAPSPSPRALQDAVAAAMANMRFPAVDQRAMQQAITEATAAALRTQVGPLEAPAAASSERA